MPTFVAAIPGNFLVDHLRWMKNIPDWFPFASLKRNAKMWREWALDMANMPYDDAKKLVVSFFLKGVAGL